MTDYRQALRGTVTEVSIASWGVSSDGFCEPMICGFISAAGTTCRRDFDCTDQILVLDIEALRNLTDDSATVKRMVPLWLISEVRESFLEKHGLCSKFEPEISVVEAVRDFFEVTSLAEITEARLNEAKAKQEAWNDCMGFSR